MSTLATADLGPSDDEADTDFVPDLPKPKGSKRARRPRGGDGGDSDSGSSDSDDDADEPDTDEVKRLKAEAAEAIAAERKKRAAEAFRLMQEEARMGASSSSAPTSSGSQAGPELVEVRRPRRFAGETIFETVMLPKDHPDAIKYGVATDAAPPPETTATAPSDASSLLLSSTPDPATPMVVADATLSAPAAGTGPPLRRPVRKRPRQSLEAMAAAIDAGKKMTTLEKSQMDWNSHMSKENKLREEVAQHRRSGGYLEKQAFLDRVGQRRAGMGEGSSSSSGRRRP